MVMFQPEMTCLRDSNGTPIVVPNKDMRGVFIFSDKDKAVESITTNKLPGMPAALHDVQAIDQFINDAEATHVIWDIGHDGHFITKASAFLSDLSPRT